MRPLSIIDLYTRAQMVSVVVRICIFARFVYAVRFVIRCVFINQLNKVCGVHARASLLRENAKEFNLVAIVMLGCRACPAWWIGAQKCSRTTPGLNANDRNADRNAPCCESQKTSTAATAK